MSDPLDTIARAAQEAMAALAPAALGSAVGQAWSQGLTWRQRVVQWLTGILVSYYVTMGVAEVLHLGPFASQSIGFVIAMMAFEVAPKVIAGAAATAGQIPQFVAQFVARWTGKAPTDGGQP